MIRSSSSAVPRSVLVPRRFWAGVPVHPFPCASYWRGTLRGLGRAPVSVFEAAYICRFPPEPTVWARPNGQWRGAAFKRDPYFFTPALRVFGV